MSKWTETITILESSSSYTPPVWVDVEIVEAEKRPEPVWVNLVADVIATTGFLTYNTSNFTWDGIGAGSSYSLIWNNATITTWGS